MLISPPPVPAMLVGDRVITNEPGPGHPFIGIVAPAPIQPPTLREWLGDRVSELGRWAEVLREQPVPAGMITRWEWMHVRATGEWALRCHYRHGAEDLQRLSVVYAATIPFDADADDTCAFNESLQMALFTRHPNVAPEPKPAAFPWYPFAD